jgi:hypothetical protein
MLKKVLFNEDVWESGGIAPRILTLDSRWIWVASFTFRPLYPPEKSPVPISLSLQGRTIMYSNFRIFTPRTDNTFLHRITCFRVIKPYPYMNTAVPWNNVKLWTRILMECGATSLSLLMVHCCAQRIATGTVCGKADVWEGTFPLGRHNVRYSIACTDMILQPPAFNIWTKWEINSA